MDSNPTPPKSYSKTGYNFKQNKDIEDNSSQNSDSVMGIGSKKIGNKTMTDFDNKNRKSVKITDTKK